jgi:hypothetical protein
MISPYGESLLPTLANERKSNQKASPCRALIRFLSDARRKNAKSPEACLRKCGAKAARTSGLMAFFLDRRASLKKRVLSEGAAFCYELFLLGMVSSLGNATKSLTCEQNTRK